MNANLYRIILPVTDIKKAESFYSTVLGVTGTRVSPGRHYFTIGEIIIACYDPVADGDEQGNWQFHKNQYIYIAVSNLEKTLQLAKTFPCESSTEIQKMPWGERLFYINDPFGIPVCFVDETTVFKG